MNRKINNKKLIKLVCKKKENYSKTETTWDCLDNLLSDSCLCSLFHCHSWQWRRQMPAMCKRMVLRCSGFRSSWPDSMLGWRTVIRSKLRLKPNIGRRRISWRQQRASIPVLPARPAKPKPMVRLNCHFVVLPWCWSWIIFHSDCVAPFTLSPYEQI